MSESEQNLSTPRTQYPVAPLAKTLKADPEKLQNTNALRYAVKSASNRDSYLAKLSAADCLKLYNDSKQSKTLTVKGEAVAVRFVFVIVGGTIEGSTPDGQPRSISGGRRIAGWSQDGGVADKPDWAKQLVGATVAAAPAAATIYENPPGPGPSGTANSGNAGSAGTSGEGTLAKTTDAGQNAKA